MSSGSAVTRNESYGKVDDGTIDCRPKVTDDATEDARLEANMSPVGQLIDIIETIRTSRLQGEEVEETDPEDLLFTK